MESHLSSAAAFVEGGIQDACEDACSICLEAFCESDPSTVTSCKHEFHLQCILEWCQRSSQCPMCWQSISLKDPTSQVLLEAVERERVIRYNQSRNTTIFHLPTLGDFELQHLPVGGNDAEFEERIIQHLAAAATMGRAHNFARREGHRDRSGAHGRPQFLVLSTHQSAPSIGSVSASSGERGEVQPDSIVLAVSQSPTASGEEATNRGPRVIPTQADQVAALSSGSSYSASSLGLPSDQTSAGQSTSVIQDRAGPSDIQSFSESLKSRLNAVSMRCKESITKSTHGWKERLFSRNTSVADLSSEVRREVNAGIASVSSMMERLDNRQNRRISGSAVDITSDHSATELSNERATENNSSTHQNNNPSASCVTTSSSN
ncbi:E3 ubiquitin-protein ligase RHF2A-like [Typha latifolia]|uniref:E3 ubiquitin-protein ligase RHF2A-like n=1 Tax=Typha latifolia TaxID=4733 RepID=UPI003C2E9A5F